MGTKKNPLGDAANSLSPVILNKRALGSQLSGGPLESGRDEPEAVSPPSTPEIEPGPSAPIPAPAAAAPVQPNRTKVISPRDREKLSPEQKNFLAQALGDADWLSLFFAQREIPKGDILNVTVRMSADLSYRLEEVMNRIYPRKFKDVDFYRKMISIYVDALEAALAQMPEETD